MDDDMGGLIDVINDIPNVIDDVMKAFHDVVHDIHNVHDDVMRALYEIDIDMCMSMIPLLFKPPTY